ncbi:MAG: membrane dipeptidase [Isosphaeraceae bacterium]
MLAPAVREDLARGGALPGGTADHIDPRVPALTAGSSKHAAIGSDLDGGFGTEQTPVGMDRISDLQDLDEILTRRGYSGEAIDDIFHGNWLRLSSEFARVRGMTSREAGRRCGAGAGRGQLGAIRWKRRRGNGKPGASGREELIDATSDGPRAPLGPLLDQIDRGVRIRRPLDREHRARRRTAPDAPVLRRLTELRPWRPTCVWPACRRTRPSGKGWRGRRALAGRRGWPSPGWSGDPRLDVLVRAPGGRGA